MPAGFSAEGMAWQEKYFPGQGLCCAPVTDRQFINSNTLKISEKPSF